MSGVDVRGFGNKLLKYKFWHLCIYLRTLFHGHLYFFRLIPVQNRKLIYLPNVQHIMPTGCL